MEQKRPKFRLRLNLFDAIVLILAVAAAVVLLVLTLRGATGEDVLQPDRATVRYTVRFQRWEEGKSALIHEGDELSDNIKNYEAGHVVAIQPVPAESLVGDRDNHRFVRGRLEGFEDVLVTVEADCTVDDEVITVGGGYELRVGNMGYFRGVGYMAAGPIVAIEIEEAEK